MCVFVAVVVVVVVVFVVVVVVVVVGGGGTGWGGVLNDFYLNGPLASTIFCISKIF